MKWKEIPKEEIPNHDTIQLATFHYSQEDILMYLIPDESPSTEVKGQQGQRNIFLGEVKSIAKEIAVDFYWENNLDRQRGYQHFRKEYDDWVKDNKYINSKLASQPQEVGQDELWDEFYERWSNGLGCKDNIKRLSKSFTLIKK